MTDSCELLIWYAASNFFVLVFIFAFLKLRFSKPVCLLILTACYATLIALDYIHLFILETSFPLSKIVITSLEILIVQSCALFIAKYRDARALFTGLVSSNYVLIGFGSAVIIYSSSGSFVLALFSLIGINAVFVSLMIKFGRKSYLHIQEQGISGWLSLCLIPCLFYLLFYSLSLMPVTAHLSFEDFPRIIVALATMISTYAMVMRYTRLRSEEGASKQALALIEGYVESLKRESHLLASDRARLAIIKHDMRHYLNILSHMLADQDIEGMKKVLCEVVGELDTETLSIYCDDPLLNTALQAVASQSTKAGVELKTSIVVPTIPEDSQIKFAAIAINLIENAIRAASELPAESTLPRCVEVTIKPVKNQLFLRVSNPYYNKIDLDKESKLPRSHQGEGHGFGLKSVEDFAELQGGAFSYTYSDTTFEASLFIPLN